MNCPYCNREITKFEYYEDIKMCYFCYRDIVRPKDGWLCDLCERWQPKEKRPHTPENDPNIRLCDECFDDWNRPPPNTIVTTDEKGKKDRQLL